MALFSFFKTKKPKRFNFIPRYYDAKKERLQEIIDRHKEDSKDNPEAMKSRIKHGFQTRGLVDFGYESRLRKKSNRTLLIVMVSLFVITYLLLSKYSTDIISVVK